MSVTSTFEVLPQSNANEYLKIDLEKKHFRGEVNAFKFIDKTTKQFIVYVPSFELSGYGETEEKAIEMAKESLTDFCEFLLESKDHIQTELMKYGWKRQYFKTEFSKAYIDQNGNLQNLNAENNKVERVKLAATA